MIIYSKFILLYPLITLNTNTTINSIPYKPYTTTRMIENQEIKVYEKYWNSIFKENFEKIE
jgi:hypothetical protein